MPLMSPNAAILASIALATTVATQQPVELGRIEWRRDFDAARAEARRSDKPILLLFQEVPG